MCDSNYAIYFTAHHSTGKPERVQEMSVMEKFEEEIKWSK